MTLKELLLLTQRRIAQMSTPVYQGGIATIMTRILTATPYTFMNFAHYHAVVAIQEVTRFGV